MELKFPVGLEKNEVLIERDGIKIEVPWPVQIQILKERNKKAKYDVIRNEKNIWCILSSFASAKIKKDLQNQSMYCILFVHQANGRLPVWRQKNTGKSRYLIIIKLNKEACLICRQASLL